MGDLSVQNAEIHQVKQLPNLFDNRTWAKMPEVMPLDGVESNYGELDSTRPVTMGEEQYDSVVHLTMDDGSECTGTVVEIEGYDLIGSGSLIVTAAHCVDDTTGVIVSGNRIDEQGQVTSYNALSENIWMHPEHVELNPAPYAETIDSTADIAILHVDQGIPEDVQPSVMQTTDVDGLMAAAQDAVANNETTSLNEATSSPPTMTVAGFSGDKAGLHTHEGVQMIGFYDGVIVSDADTAQRASGGPNFMTDGNGQLHVIAVNSAGGEVSADNPNPDDAYSTVLDEGVMDTVPFVEKTSNVDVGQQQEYTGEDPVVGPMLKEDPTMFNGEQEGASPVEANYSQDGNHLEVGGEAITAHYDTEAAGAGNGYQVPNQGYGVETPVYDSTAYQM